MTQARVFMTDVVDYDAVGPIMRAGDLADAVIDAIEEDNPEQNVMVTDRGDYLNIHTLKDCRLTLASLIKQIGRAHV